MRSQVIKRSIVLDGVKTSVSIEDPSQQCMDLGVAERLRALAIEIAWRGEQRKAERLDPSKPPFA